MREISFAEQIRNRMKIKKTGIRWKILIKIIIINLIKRMAMQSKWKKLLMLKLFLALLGKAEEASIAVGSTASSYGITNSFDPALLI